MNALEPGSTGADGMGDVVVERHGATVVARFDRAAHRNSVQGTLLAELLRIIENADADEATRAVITTGNGSVYCSGADGDAFIELNPQAGVDLHELGYQGTLGGDWGIPVRSRSGRRSDTLGTGRWALRLLDADVPTIAALNGAAAGGGLGLALLHDIRIASRRAVFIPTFLAVGASPELGVSWTLPRLVGEARAFDLLTRTAPITADEALELGLVHQVVEPGELMDAALARARQFDALEPAAVGLLKRLLRHSSTSSLPDQLEREWHHQTRLLGFADTGPRLTAHLRSHQR